MTTQVSSSPSNFAFLASYDARLSKLGASAERLFHDDPVLTLMRLRQLGEILALEAAARVGIYVAADEKQHELLRRLRDRNAIPRDVADLFHGLRKAGNTASHEVAGTASEALHQLKMARLLAIWFHRTFGDPRFKPSAFVPPRPPEDATAPLKAQLELLKKKLSDTQSEAERARQSAEDAALERLGVEERARLAEEERATLEALLDEVADREAEMVARLASLQAQAAAAPRQVETAIAQAERAASLLDLDEADTRRLIDEKLRANGWEVDTFELTWGKGIRPQKNKNLAIAEWPTSNGPADYMLFVGLDAIGVIEAKRAAKDVAASIEQAKRYSRGYVPKGDDRAVTGPSGGGPWGDYKIPFLFATNGRPYLKQLATKSGTWFLDARRPENTSRPFDGWYTPEGLVGMLRQDVDAAHAKLDTEPTDYLNLRDYQIRAIRAAEERLAEGQQALLLAMATGTGKTRTCIGLCYRLLKTKRFRRILFLVDRTALGIQATNAFKDARLENLQTFAEIFDLKELGDIQPESDTRLQIATVQGMVARVLYQEADIPAVDTYDCIVIDECHRGYLLDREMSDAELTFRSEADYISKYRRVLEHFDAVKIGLTATPAIHATEPWPSRCGTRWLHRAHDPQRDRSETVAKSAGEWLCAVETQSAVT